LTFPLAGMGSCTSRTWNRNIIASTSVTKAISARAIARGTRAGKDQSHAGKDLIHVGKDLIHVGKGQSHVGKDQSHAGKDPIHAGKDLIHAGIADLDQRVGPGGIGIAIGRIAPRKVVAIVPRDDLVKG
jgi:hypothetical protein